MKEQIRKIQQLVQFHINRIQHGEGNGNPLQCSCLENPMDGEPGRLQSMGLHRVRHDWSDLAFMHALEKAMATHSSTWRIPGMEEPGGLPSMESHRVGHNWRDLAAAAAACFLLKWCKCIASVFKIKTIRIPLSWWTSNNITKHGEEAEFGGKPRMANCSATLCCHC